jgi:coenzyme F420-0:L-glutamate ligase/coenzyme F420-1:gamma-L-glutamate ligase
MIAIIPLNNFPIIKEGDNIAEIIVQTIKKNKVDIRKKDIIVIAQTIISRAEGSIVDLTKIKPSIFAKNLAKRCKKSPEHIEIILREAKNICKFRDNILVTETNHGFVCDNSGVDKSNCQGETKVTLLPKNPDLSAKRIREQIHELTKKEIAIIISDTHHRPFRKGGINITLGCSGIKPIISYVNQKDLFGYKLEGSTVALADQITAAAGLAMGEGNEGIPVVIVRGYEYNKEEIPAKVLLRPEEKDYFR